MATILPFVRNGPVRKRSSVGSTVPGTGTLVLFTGIRVEYGIPPAASAEKPPPRRRRRNPAKDAVLA